MTSRPRLSAAELALIPARERSRVDQVRVCAWIAAERDAGRSPVGDVVAMLERELAAAKKNSAKGTKALRHEGEGAGGVRGKAARH